MNHRQLTDKELIRHLSSSDDDLVQDLVERLDALQDYSCEGCSVLDAECEGLEDELRDERSEVANLSEALWDVADALRAINPLHESLNNDTVKKYI